MSERLEDIAAAIERAIAERDRLVERGLRHAAQFTWLRCGRVYLDGFYERLAA